jgi:hypothetical protein
LDLDPVAAWEHHPAVFPFVDRQEPPMRANRALILTACAAAGLAFAACAGVDKKDAPAQTQSETAKETPDSTGAARLPADDFDASCCEKRNLDLNGDGVPDAYQFFKTVEGEVVVLRKEVDVNFDGAIDLIRNFNETGDLISERLDTDFDRKVDVVNIFEKGAIVRKEYDTNFDNAVDVIRFYEKGIISRKEADLNHDGKTDYWEYYEAGKIDRVGIDRDADGEVDEWETMAEEG